MDLVVKDNGNNIGDIIGADTSITMDMVTETTISYRNKFADNISKITTGDHKIMEAMEKKNLVDRLQRICDVLNYVDDLKAKLLRLQVDSQFVGDIRNLEEGIAIRTKETEEYIEKVFPKA